MSIHFCKVATRSYPSFPAGMATCPSSVSAVLPDSPCPATFKWTWCQESTPAGADPCVSRRRRGQPCPRRPQREVVESLLSSRNPLSPLDGRDVWSIQSEGGSLRVCRRCVRVQLPRALRPSLLVLPPPTSHLLFPPREMISKCDSNSWYCRLQPFKRWSIILHTHKKNVLLL